MKKHLAEFCKRGLLCAAGGPLILAIIYGCLDASGVITSLSPKEVMLGIITVTIMAFIAAGSGMIYQVERLPIVSAMLIQGAVLYLDYLVIYLINSWMPRNWRAIGVFSLIFVIGYAIIWLIIYLCTRAKTQSLNKKLNK